MWRAYFSGICEKPGLNPLDKRIRNFVEESFSAAKHRKNTADTQKKLNLLQKQSMHP